MKTLARFARFAAFRSAGVVLALLVVPSAHADNRSSTTPTLFRACAGAFEHGSTSIVDNDGRQTWTIKLNGGDCSIDFRMEGRPRFNDDFTDLVSLSPDGSFRIDVKDDGVRRQLEIEPGPNGLVRTWKVNGREQRYDDDARAWLAAFLIELDRRTAVGADQRLPVLLRRGGVAGVLAETGHMPAEYARSVYYGKLAKAVRLTDADVVRILDQAASMKTTDYYASELVKSLGARAGGGADVRAAMFRLIQSMDGDYYRAESVKLAVGKGRLGAREVDFVIDVLPKMDSDYYKTEVLKSLLAAGSVDAAQRKRLAGVARDIHEDAYAFEFVKALAASGDPGPGGAAALIAAAATIQGDYYLSESIGAILSGPTLSEGDLLTIVKTVAPTKSEYYRSEMLRRVVAHRAATAAVREAVVNATGGMSSYYKEEVERAAGKR